MLVHNQNLNIFSLGDILPKEEIMNRRGSSSIPPAVSVSVRQVHGLIQALDDFLEPYKPFWGERSEPRETGCQYLKGLIANLPRKSAEPIAELFGKERKTFQRFVGTNRWPDKEIRSLMAIDLAQTLGHPDGVLSFDPSAFPKQGKDSVGVARQWCGVKGKTDNCQVGCFWNYASPRGSSLVGAELYLPDFWAKDNKGRTKCHVPTNVRFLKKWEIADQMLKKIAPLFPHARILADAEIGRCGEFRDRLAAGQENYLLDIPRDLEIRVYQGTFLIPAPTTPEKWAEKMAGHIWKRFNIRDTARGALVMEGIMVNVVTLRKDKTLRQEILVVKRDIGTGELKYALANSNGPATLRRLLQDWSRRHAIEENFQRGKSDLGMDHYEVRTWTGWHHHMTMVMLAMCFLERERIKRRRAFSPSDGFGDRVAHDGNDSPPDFGSRNAGQNGPATPETLSSSEVLPCKETKRIKNMCEHPSKTLVNSLFYA